MTPDRLAILSALVCAGVAAGCGNLHWTKPGADATAVARDQEACRAQALGRPAQADAAVGRPESRESGQPLAAAAAHSSNTRFVAEHEALQRCMLQRGYELRP